MDLQAALAGGGPGGPPGLGPGGPPPGLPPGLGPAGPTGIGAPPPPDQAPPDDTSGGQDQYATSLDALDGAEAALHAFIQLDPDEGDRAVAASALQTVLKLKASNQKSVQAGDMKGLQRALAGGGAYAAGPGGPGG